MFVSVGAKPPFELPNRQLNEGGRPPSDFCAHRRRDTKLKIGELTKGVDKMNKQTQRRLWAAIDANLHVRIMLGMSNLWA